MDTVTMLEKKIAEQDAKIEKQEDLIAELLTKLEIASDTIKLAKKMIVLLIQGEFDEDEKKEILEFCSK